MSRPETPRFDVVIHDGGKPSKTLKVIAAKDFDAFLDWLYSFSPQQIPDEPGSFAPWSAAMLRRFEVISETATELSRLKLESVDVAGERRIVLKPDDYVKLSDGLGKVRRGAAELTGFL